MLGLSERRGLEKGSLVSWGRTSPGKVLPLGAGTLEAQRSGCNSGPSEEGVLFSWGWHLPCGAVRAGSETPGRNWKVDQLLLAEARVVAEETLRKTGCKTERIGPFLQLLAF